MTVDGNAALPRKRAFACSERASTNVGTRTQFLYTLGYVSSSMTESSENYLIEERQSRAYSNTRQLSSIFLLCF